MGSIATPGRGDREAKEAFRLAFRAFERGDYPNARAQYESAASRGSVDAMVNLASMCKRGLGGAQEPSRAVELYQKAIQLSRDRDAMVALGLMYRRGEGVAVNLPEAIALYEDAASLGSDAAMNNLAIMYWRGDAVARQPRLALRLYEQAASLGNAEAKRNMEVIRAVLAQEEQQKQPKPNPSEPCLEDSRESLSWESDSTGAELVQQQLVDPKPEEPSSGTMYPPLEVTEVHSTQSILPNSADSADGAAEQASHLLEESECSLASEDQLSMAERCNPASDSLLDETLASEPDADLEDLLGPEPEADTGLLSLINLSAASTRPTGSRPFRATREYQQAQAMVRKYEQSKRSHYEQELQKARALVNRCTHSPPFHPVLE